MTTIILAIAALVVLGILILRLGRKLAVFLLALGGVAAVSAVAWAMGNQAQATRQVAQVAMMNASLTVILSLAIILVLLLISIGAGLVIWQWWKQREERRRLEHMMYQAQLYALMNGFHPSPRATTLGTTPSTGLPAGGNVFIIPGAQTTWMPTLPDNEEW